VAEASSEGGVGRPDGQPNNEGGGDVAAACQQGVARGLAFQPTALPSKRDYRHQLVGHNGMKHADDGDGKDEQEATSIVQGVQSETQEEQAHADGRYAAQSAGQRRSFTARA
jgi:hypothetical protein